MVVMAIVTTLLATPVFRYVYPNWNSGHSDSRPA